VEEHVYQVHNIHRSILMDEVKYQVHNIHQSILLDGVIYSIAVHKIHVYV